MPHAQPGTDDYGRLPKKVAIERYRKALSAYPDPENMMGSAAKETWPCFFEKAKSSYISFRKSFFERMR